MNKIIKSKSLNLPCECAGGVKTCGFLRIVKFDDNYFEFCWVKKSAAKGAKIGVCVNNKNLEKLKKFL